MTENSANGRLLVVRSLTLPANPASNENSLHFVTIELNLEMPPACPVRKESTLLVTGSLIHYPANPTFCSESCAEFASAFSGRVPRSSDGICRQARCWRGSVARTDSPQMGGSMPTGRTYFVDMRNQFRTHQMSGRTSELLQNHTRSSDCILTSHKCEFEKKGARPSRIGQSIEGLCENRLAWRHRRQGVRIVSSIVRRRSHIVALAAPVMRAKEQMEIPSNNDLDLNRQLLREFIKLGEEYMSKMAKYCREAGLEHMFFACLKIFDKKISDNEAKETDAMANHPSAIHTRRFLHCALVQVDHMNDRRRYQKLLQNMCKSAGCSFFVRHCHATTASAPRPTILIGLCGDIEGVKNVLKRWRTNRVDIDARNKPCLERMMTVLMEGGVRGTIRESSTSVHGSSADCSLDELKELIINVFGDDWVKVIGNNDINSTH